MMTTTSGHLGFGGGLVLAVLAGCAEPAPEPPPSDGVAEGALGACGVPTYAPGVAYGAGQRVEAGASVYECKPWPFSGWCGAGAAYAPGSGWAWRDAWALIGACEDGGDPDPDPDEPEPPDPDPDEPDPDPPGGDDWQLANLTWFTSYPAPGSEECEEFNGCQWAGRFAFVDGQQSEAWVASHNIAAVHSRDAEQYALKTLRLRADGREIDVTVYDMCADSDCDGCCTANASETGFLIDLEQHTMDRFGADSDLVEWTCLDCD